MYEFKYTCSILIIYINLIGEYTSVKRVLTLQWKYTGGAWSFHSCTCCYIIKQTYISKMSKGLKYNI